MTTLREGTSFFSEEDGIKYDPVAYDIDLVTLEDPGGDRS